MAEQHVVEMAMLVFKRLGSPGSFNLQLYKGAFAAEAHRKGIYHGQNKTQYNFLFKNVMEEVKKLIRTPKGQQPVSKSSDKTHFTMPPAYVDRKMIAAGDYGDD